MKKVLKKLVASALCLVMVLSLAACNNSTPSTSAPSTAAPTQAPTTAPTQAPTTAPTEAPTVAPTEAPKKTAEQLNEEKTLIIQENTFDQVFNPFFYSNAYDGDAIGLVNVGLLTMDATGAVVAGDQYDTVAKSYEIYYTNDLVNYTKKDTFEAGDYVVYEMVIKNGGKFSDGSAVSADDVLFNYYVYLDPAYNGSSTLYTLPILGMADYRTQVVNSAVIGAKVAKIFAAGDAGYTANSDFTEDEYNAYWTGFKASGKAFASEIVEYVAANYGGTADYAGGNSAYSGKSGIDFTVEGKKVAFGMAMWGFGAFDKTDAGFQDTFTDANGKQYDMTATFPTLDDYWDCLVAAYEGDYRNLSDTESAGSDLIAMAEEAFIGQFTQVGSVKEITGLVKGKTTIDGTEYETVKVILTEQNPKAILSVGVTVAPKAYYTAGYSYPEGAVVNYGCQLGIGGDDSFMKHLATLNSAPMGAGTYKFVSADGDGVTFVRNEYHETMGGENVTNAKIKNVYMKVVDSGKEFDALKAGDVDYATVSASASAVEEIATLADITSILVDNLGYGYICLNPAFENFKNVNVRIALQSVLDLSKVNDYYPNGLADVIYRAQSQVSWAYPEGAEAIYAFDETLTTAKEYFQKAGYTLGADGKFTDVPEVDFYLPSNTDDHPAGGIFLKAQSLLATIGITANIKVDANLIANIKTAPIPSYALAWSSSADPDMYQVYHWKSAANSVYSNGIQELGKGAYGNDLGTILVKKLDGSEVEMNQSEAIYYLGELIEEGTKYMSVEERKPIYEKALEVLAQLAIEIPTYQRKNMFAYNNSIIDGTTLSSTVTPYWGPLAEIWKLSFAAEK